MQPHRKQVESRLQERPSSVNAGYHIRPSTLALIRKKRSPLSSAASARCVRSLKAAIYSSVMRAVSQRSTSYPAAFVNHLLVSGKIVIDRLQIAIWAVSPRPPRAKLGARPRVRTDYGQVDATAFSTVFGK